MSNDNILPGLNSGDIVDYVLQRHDTDKRPGRPHYDLRLGNKDTGLFSWALPGMAMPEPGGAPRLAVGTRRHAYGYRNFAGRIPPGYGAGEVSIVDSGQTHIKNTNNTVSFTLGKDNPISYTLIRRTPASPYPGRNYRGGCWLLIAKSTPKDGKDPKLRVMRADDVDSAIHTIRKIHSDMSPSKTKKEASSSNDIVNFVIYGQNNDIKAELNLEIADNATKQRKGLSGRTEIGSDGMFFSTAGAYWMKDVEFPLDLLYLAQDGTILQILGMEVTPEGEEHKIYTGPKDAETAIELPGGFTKANGIKPGDIVDIVDLTGLMDV